MIHQDQCKWLKMSRQQTSADSRERGRWRVCWALEMCKASFESQRVICPAPPRTGGMCQINTDLLGRVLLIFSWLLSVKLHIFTGQKRNSRRECVSLLVCWNCCSTVGQEPQWWPERNMKYADILADISWGTWRCVDQMPTIRSWSLCCEFRSTAAVARAATRWRIQRWKKEEPLDCCYCKQFGLKCAGRNAHQTNLQFVGTSVSTWSTGRTLLVSRTMKSENKVRNDGDLRAKG